MKNKKSVFDLEKILVKLEQLHTSFDYIRISLASPLRVRSWAQRVMPYGEILGEIKKAETINFRSYEPERYGLFCERIFGPIHDWKCKCGKYNGFVLDKLCEECGIEIIESRVRRYRMGYIDLNYPVVHLWYLKGSPNYLYILLGCLEKDRDEKKKSEFSLNDLEQIIYFKPLFDLPWFFQPFLMEPKTQRIETLSWFEPKKKLKRDASEILKAALESLDLKQEIKFWRSSLELSQLQQANIFSSKKSEGKQENIHLKRIRILESFFSSKTNPSWMILTTLPVLPPSLRPLIELENGRLVAADINEIYRLIIIRNQRLSDPLSYAMLDLFSAQNKRLLQESVDSLIDNARVPKEKQITVNDKALKSLTEILEGKQGRFRQSLLGKRVDYSGRSVIVVGPLLRLNQCGLPYEMAKELFQPFLINQLLKTKIKASSHNTRLANSIIRKNKPFIWTLLTFLTRKYSILLNRAPTLHRFGIQAFDPLLILGQAIHLHPLVCTGFNADFDGDQMAVHLPLYEASQLEVRTMMRPSYNVLSPSNGEVILKPTQDMVIGCYYLTFMITNHKQLQKKWFPNESSALCAFYEKKITLHTPILVRYTIPSLTLQCQIKKQELQFNNPLVSILSEYEDQEKKNPFWNQEIIISKVFPVGNLSEKYYFLTNIGIFVAYMLGEHSYQITNFFSETTAGRLIFSKNFQNSIQEYA